MMLDRRVKFGEREKKVSEERGGKKVVAHQDQWNDFAFVSLLFLFPPLTCQCCCLTRRPVLQPSEPGARAGWRGASWSREKERESERKAAEFFAFEAKKK